MHGPVRVPEGVGVGSAKVVVAFEAWKEGHVAASECQVPVVAPPPGLKREAVSSRLLQTLMHPDQSGMMVGLRYSADGRRLFAGHYSSGIVQVWDAISGRQLNSIETGSRLRSTSDYLLCSPDGKFLYIDEGKVRARSLPTKEKHLIHWTFSGGVRLWEVDSGKPLHYFPPGRERGVRFLDLSPDGSTLLTMETLSADYELNARGKWFGSLWDARTGQRRASLSEDINPYALFWLDSKTVMAKAVNDKNEMTAVLLLDAATGTIRRSFLVDPRFRKVFAHSFSPDGKLLACAMNRTKDRHWVKCWEIETGRETIYFEGQENEILLQPSFSPDGRTLVFGLLKNDYSERELCLIDVEKRKPVKRILLGKAWKRIPVFSPDSRWVAIIHQETPRNQSLLTQKPDAVPQPRILLIEAATGEVRETIVAPSAIALSLCFSPDGKTLASGGDGRVLLWDLTRPPGEPLIERRK